MMKSEIMARIRGNHLKPETELHQALLKLGLRPSRNVRGLPGAPDFAFSAERLAVFLHGCFWHGCPRHWRRPHRNGDAWERKVVANRRRDAKACRALQRLGWGVLTIWEHQLACGPGLAAQRVLRRLSCK